VTCGFCNRDFEEDRGQPGCRACPLGSDCGLVRCPFCGYENPATPKVVAFVQGLFGRKRPPPRGAERAGALPVVTLTAEESR
jgi:hypothetical protein